MDPETNPVDIIFAESQRLEGFADFWRRRIDIEKVYLDNLIGLRVPHLTGNGQLTELATKTRELLIDELKERRRGFEKLKAAFKGLTDTFRTEKGPNYFDQWGRTIKQSLVRSDPLTAEIASAKYLTEMLAVEAQKRETLSISSSAKKATPAKGLARFLSPRDEQPDDTSRFLSADSAYRQMVQKINDEKIMIQKEIMPQNVHWVKHHRNCIDALGQVASTFSAMHSDLAQVLNSTSLRLYSVSSSMDGSKESASFAERLDHSFTSVMEPCRYTSYEISSPLRPTTMLFGCSLPDERDGASIGQRAVAEAFETILSSAASKHPRSLYKAICDAHTQPGGNDVKLSALQLESLWDPVQEKGGVDAVNYLAKAPSASLLVYFLTRLPEPFLPLNDSDLKSLIRMDSTMRNLTKWEIVPVYPVTRVFGRAGNRMGTAKRYVLARLFLTLQSHQDELTPLVSSRPEGFQILTRTPDLPPSSPVAAHFSQAIQNIDKIINQSFGDSLILPADHVVELKRAGLYTD